ncbi:MAG: glycosyltransferase [Alphaproteobacteria bacterium]|nr:glycosyltransferase [Alphaproteobacteria bacterium]
MTSPNALISIVVCAYNAEETLDRCLSSLVRQTYRAIQIVCIDDGSNDGTAALFETYAARDKRVLVVHQENGGISAARNIALKHAAGDYLMFCDADDWFHPDMCRKMIGTLVREKVDWVSCGIEPVFETMPVLNFLEYRSFYYRVSFLGKHSNQVVREGIHFLLWNKIFRMDLVRKYRLAFPVGRIHEDDAFVMSYFAISASICGLPDKLYYHTLTDSSQIGTLHQMAAASAHRFDKLYVAQFIQDFLLRHRLFYRNQAFFAHVLDVGVRFWAKKVSAADYPYVMRLIAGLVRRMDAVFLERHPLLWHVKKKNIARAIQVLNQNRSMFLAFADAESKQPAAGQQIIPIAYYANAACKPYLSVSIQSIARHASPDCFYEIYIFSISEQFWDEYDRMLPANVKLIRVPLPLYLHRDNAFYSEMARQSEKCYRLMIPEILREYDKIVCLDYDTLVLDDIAQLYRTDMNGCAVAGVRDASSEVQKNHIASVLGIDAGSYINAGVLLIDPQAYIRADIAQECCRHFRQGAQWTYKDQDLLNRTCAGRIHVLPDAWNRCWHTQLSEADWKGLEPGAAVRMPSAQFVAEAKIIHYTTRMKPWILKAHPLSVPWWRHARHSPYYRQLIKDKGQKGDFFAPWIERHAVPRGAVRLHAWWRFLSAVTIGRTARKYRDKAAALAEAFFKPS